MARIHGQQETYCLESLLKLENIQHCAHASHHDRHILALVTIDGDVILYYIAEDGYITLRRIPWFVEPDRRISALTFHPHGSWLLATSWDGSLHMIPAMAIADAGAQGDTRWNTLDLTSFPNVTSSPPSCVLWWRSKIEGSQVAIIGTVTGDVVMYDLVSRERVGSVTVTGPLDSLRLYHDSTVAVLLLMTNKARQQWKLLLESREAGFVWPLENRNNKADPSPTLSPTPAVRSRLQGLKQMSVEKIASIRQRLAERTRSITPQSLQMSLPALPAQNTSPSQSSMSSQKDSSDSECPLADSQTSQSSLGPEKLSTEFFLWPQQYLAHDAISGLHQPSSTFTLNTLMNAELIPQRTYRLPSSSNDVLMTSNFIFAVDAAGSCLYILSCKTAETRTAFCNEAMKPEALVDKFELNNGETLLSFFLLSNSHGGKENTAPENSGSSHRVKRNAHGGRQVPRVKMSVLRGMLQPSVEEELSSVKGFQVPSCVIVTNRNLYLVLLSEPVSRRVLDYLIRGCNIDKAEHLCSVFGLDLQKLLQLAGDEQINRGQLAAGAKLHHLARSRASKILLKFSLKGTEFFLLTLINDVLKNSLHHEDLTAGERAHFVRMFMLGFVKELLDAKRKDPATEKRFQKLLRDSRIHDQSLSPSLIGEAGLFKALHILCEFRSLAPECLEVLTHIMEQIMNKNNKKGTVVRYCLLASLPGFWECATEYTLQEGIALRPSRARIHFRFVLENLDTLSKDILKRLVILYDPTTPTFHHISKATLYDARRRVCRDYSDESTFSLYKRNGVVVGDALDVITMFLIVLLKLIEKTSYRRCFVDGMIPTNVKNAEGAEKEDLDKKKEKNGLPLVLKRRVVSPGSTHVVAVRNCTVYAWGAGGDGSLGLGPVSRSAHLPQEVASFGLGNICVASVACGRGHTLALTSHGVFAWGSSNRGQLGIPKCGQSPYPRRIPQLHSEGVAAISAGQYHSIAVTSSGKVLTWGWGVFGQLGHRSVEDLTEPKTVEELRGKPVVEVAGGHAHTVVLLRDGTVLTFGSSAFGQLGCGKTAKSTVPVVVQNLPQDICSVATGYFHTLALTRSNKIYTWGLSPQDLRIQAQAKKKARVISQEPASPQNKAAAKPRSPSTSPSRANCCRTPSPYLSESSVPVECQPTAVADKVSLFTEEGKLVAPPGWQSKTSEAKESEGKPEGCDCSKEDPTLVIDDGMFEVPLTSPIVEDKKTIGDAPIARPNTIGDTKEGKEAETSTCENGAQQNKEQRSPEPHLLPSLVDTSYVEGTIREISCGSHHSALVTVDGAVYTWGRNTEGQLGIVGIREASGPSRVRVLAKCYQASGSAADDQQRSCSKEKLKEEPRRRERKSTTGSSDDGDLGEDLATTRFDAVCCGSECTFAVDTKGRIWGWGRNEHGQIGRVPVREPGRDCDGKTIKLPKSKRVIKIPLGLQDYTELPLQITNLPHCKEYKRDSLCRHASDWPHWVFLDDKLCPYTIKLPSFKDFEDPPYGIQTLHHALRFLHPCYNISLVREKCLDMKKTQAAASLAFLENDYATAISLHLTALSELADDPDELSAALADDLSEADAAADAAACEQANGEDDAAMHTFAVQGGNEEMSEGTGSSSSTSVGSRVSLDEPGSPHGGAAAGSRYWVTKEALRIAEAFFTGLELHDRQVLSSVLAELLHFWWIRELPVEPLEDFVNERYDLLAYPLGNLMFLGHNGYTKDCAALFRSFTEKFHIELCKTMTTTFCDGMCDEDRFKVIAAVIQQNPSWADLSVFCENRPAWEDGSPLIIPPEACQSHTSVIVFSCGHAVLPVDVANLTSEAQKGLSNDAARVLSHVVGNLGQESSQQTSLVKVENACPKCIGRFLRFFDV